MSSPCPHSTRTNRGQHDTCTLLAAPELAAYPEAGVKLTRHYAIRARRGNQQVIARYRTLAEARERLDGVA